MCGFCGRRRDVTRQYYPQLAELERKQARALFELSLATINFEELMELRGSELPKSDVLLELACVEQCIETLRAVDLEIEALDVEIGVVMDGFELDVIESIMGPGQLFSISRDLISLILGGMSPSFDDFPVPGFATRLA